MFSKISMKKKNSPQMGKVYEKLFTNNMNKYTNNKNVQSDW